MWNPAAPPSPHPSLRRSLRRPEDASWVAQTRDQLVAEGNEGATTMEPIHDGPMAGRTVLVTGGSGGIGKGDRSGLGHHGGTGGDHRPEPWTHRSRDSGDPCSRRWAGGG